MNFNNFLNAPLLASVTEGEGYEKAVLLVLVFTIVLILAVSRIFEEICVRISLPPVLGDLVAGVLLGVSVLHFLVFPEEGDISINPSVINFLHTFSGASIDVVSDAYENRMRALEEVIANIGLLVLLFSIGLESNLKELLKVGFQAAAVAVTGVIVPFVFGTVGLILLFHVPTVPALFAGAALTATSIGITAKVMQDIGCLQSPEGQTILGAAILDDILGIIILAVVINVVKKGTVEANTIIYLVITAVAFILGAIALKQFFGPWLMAISDQFKSPGALLIIAIVFMSTMAFIADASGLEGILGAFAAGIVLGQTEKSEQLDELLKPFIYTMTTIFFVSIGAKTDLGVINPTIPENREGLIIAGFLILTAIIGKVVAGFAAVSEQKLNKLAIGTGMVPRGEVGLVFAGLGSATGALAPSLDVAIVLTVIVTTFIAPPLLKLVFSPNQPNNTISSSEVKH